MFMAMQFWLGLMILSGGSCHRHELEKNSVIMDDSMRHYLERTTSLQERFADFVTKQCHGCSNPHPASRVNYDVTGLITFPNSGTHWIQRLFEDATGVVAMSVYKKEGSSAEHHQNFSAWFNPRGYTGRAQRRNGNQAALVKCHSAPRTIEAAQDKWSRIIHVFRHPLDNVAANVEYLKGKIERGRKLSLNATVHRMGVLVSMYVRWHCYTSLASAEVPALTVSYEHMLAHPEKELSRIVDFVGYGKTRPELLKHAAELNKAKYEPPLFEGLPTKFKSHFFDEWMWRSVMDVFEQEWTRIEGELERRPSPLPRNTALRDVCGALEKTSPFPGPIRRL
mmetsp:Transcript_61494/g.84534  ORF Transcript_61494/g.84534 Transcript_61494/m.84534 type:complete len:337 (-) Transcript_61494:259-1269(-)